MCKTEKLGIAHSGKKTIRYEILPTGPQEKKRNDINNSEGADHEDVFGGPAVGVGGVRNELFLIVLNISRFLAGCRHPPRSLRRPAHLLILNDPLA